MLPCALSDVGTQDRVVVQELIKEMAKTQNIDTAAKNRFKVVVVSEAESLSVPAQHALRRTMEKYMSNLRVILCATSASRLIPAIQSRCLLVRVPAPSDTEIGRVLKAVVATEGRSIAPDLVDRIVAASQRNLRRAILTAEACYVVQGHPRCVARVPINAHSAPDC